MFTCTNCGSQSDQEGSVPYKAKRAIGSERSKKVCVTCQYDLEEAVRLFPGDFILEEDDDDHDLERAEHAMSHGAHRH